MPSLPTLRPLNERERKLLEFMLTADFPGKEPLKAQLSRAEVCAECDCGCGSVDFRVQGLSATTGEHERIAVEAYADGLEILLWVRGEFLSSLEVIDYLHAGLTACFSPTNLKLWVPPAHSAVRDATKKDLS
jgi:hypothetical protein